MIFQTENETESNKKLREIACQSLMCEIPNFILVFVSAIMSASMIIWVDFLGSFSAVLHSLFVYIITRRIKGSEEDSYCFDCLRMETMTSFICDLLMIGGYITIVIVSVYKIMHPSGMKEGVCLYFLVKTIDILFDVYFYRKQKRILEKYSSKINETETANWKNNLLIDTLIGVLSVATYLLTKYEWSWRLNPAASLVLSVFFIMGSIKRIVGSFDEMIDKALPVPQQNEIIDLLLEHRNQCLERIDDVKIYRLDNNINIVVNARFKKTATFQQQLQLLGDWNVAVRNVYPESDVRVEIGSSNY